MRKNSLIKLIVCIVAIVAIFLAFVKPLANSIRQGLDLQGGTHVVLEAVDTDAAKVNDDAMNRVVTIMEKRVNALGLTEPIIQREGERRVIIELPGVKDPDAAIKTSRTPKPRRISRTARTSSTWNSPMKARRSSPTSRRKMSAARLPSCSMVKC